MTSSKDHHPVWEVYDLHRYCRFNIKYWSTKLIFLRRLNIGLDYLMMITAPSSAVTGLAFWTTNEGGKFAWTILTAITAFVSLAKPLLKLSVQVENLQKIVLGYRSVESQIKELESDIIAEDEYKPSMVKIFKSLQQQINVIANTEPIYGDDKNLRNQCFESVNQELPKLSFHIPSK